MSHNIDYFTMSNSPTNSPLCPKKTIYYVNYDYFESGIGRACKFATILIPSHAKYDTKSAHGFANSNHGILTRAESVTPKRRPVERTRLMVGPWLALATSCKTGKCKQFTQGEARRVRTSECGRGNALSMQSETAAWNLASDTLLEGLWISAREMSRNGLLISSTTNRKEIMNKIMITLFAVIIAAFAVSATQRARIAAEADADAAHVMEVR